MNTRQTVLTSLLFVSSFIVGCSRNAAVLKEFSDRAAHLRPDVLSACATNAVPTEAGYVVFFSVCDGRSRARVFHDQAATLEGAYDTAAKTTVKQLASSELTNAKWVRVDVVLSARELPRETWERGLSNVKNLQMREGIALDAKFKTALLEGELNGARLLSYKKDVINQKKLKKYLVEEKGWKGKSLPERLTTFTCRSWFTDESDKIYPLSQEYLSYGRRILEKIDTDLVSRQIRSAFDYLTRQIKPDGSFVYGFFSGNDSEIDSYNILRHAGTLWELADYYGRTKDPAVGETARKAAAFLVANADYRDKTTAYINEKKVDEYKLGGCGLAVIALTTYMQAFGTEEFKDLCLHLGNGILSMWDTTDGSWIHGLSKTDFSVSTKFRCVYYDGEATFALVRLFALTGDKKWLAAARKSIDMFIKRNYIQYRDQWVAYSMNEFTKHVPDPEYCVFGVRNLQGNLSVIRENHSLAPVCLELLMQGYEVVLRMREKNIATDRLNTEFNEREFIDTVRSRVESMENNWYFPEVAMYMGSPDKIANTFFDRGAGYRIRIDDVQHCLGGFIFYAEHYDKLVKSGL